MHRLATRVRILVNRAARSLATRIPSDRPAQASDPFPLPLESDLHASSVFTDPHPPLERRHESLETLRARLVYQSRKRGTLEADLLLSTFAAEHLPVMGILELREFDKLMDEPDWDIYYWAIGKRTRPERWARSALLEKLSKHAANEGKVVRRMPELMEVQS